MEKRISPWVAISLAILIGRLNVCFGNYFFEIIVVVIRVFTFMMCFI